jgi:ABC-type polar amino acid transport system ATPase subunit
MSATPEAPALAVESLEKQLGAQQVLRGVSFAVAEREVVAVIGSSGSGKSTLLRCLNLLELPDAGRIRWFGRETGLLTRDGRQVGETEAELLKHRAEVGMVFQAYNLFPHMTACENIMEAPMVVRRVRRAEAEAQALALLERVRLSHRARAYPHQMSGGEQQRVAIARALAMRPRAMLFDEVTSALDPELAGEVLATMRELAAEGMTMVVVSHEMSFVREVADRVLFMAGGRVVEQGPPAVVLGQPGSPELRSFLARVA